MDKVVADRFSAIVKDHGERMGRLQGWFANAQHDQGDSEGLRQFLSDCIDTAEKDNALVKQLCKRMADERR